MLLSAVAGAPAQVLFDAREGTPPDTQGWFYLANPLAPPPFVQVTNGLLILASTNANSTQAGYGLTTESDLDRGAGFALSFTLRLVSESHSGSPHRAGFSLIVLDAETRGIELGFWTGAIWAQADSPLFTRAETVAFDTTAAVVEYALAFKADRYTLFANGTQMLTGPLRDYTAFEGFPDPYETPNLIFLGDNTTSAQAAWGLGRVTLVHPPALTIARPGRLTWESAPELTFAVEGSTDQSGWTTIGAVTSATGSYSYTNTALPSPTILRVRYP